MSARTRRSPPLLRTGRRVGWVRIRRGQGRRRGSPVPPRGRLTSSSARCLRGHAPSTAVFPCRRSRGNGPGRSGRPSYAAMRQSYAWPPRHTGRAALPEGHSREGVAESVVAARRSSQKLPCHAHQDLGDGGWGAPPAQMKAVKDREGRQDPDHVGGFLDRASRPKLVLHGKSFGKSSVAIGFLAFPPTVSIEPPVETRICRPGCAGLPDPEPELVPRIGAGLRHGRDTEGGADAGSQRIKEALLGTELVVHGDPRHAGPLGNLAHARGRAVLDDQLAGRREDGRPGAVDLSLAPAQAIASWAHSISLTDSMYNQIGPISKPSLRPTPTIARCEAVGSARAARVFIAASRPRISRPRGASWRRAAGAADSRLSFGRLVSALPAGLARPNRLQGVPLGHPLQRPALRANAGRPAAPPGPGRGGGRLASEHRGSQPGWPPRQGPVTAQAA